jgi:DNA helicase-4
MHEVPRLLPMKPSRKPWRLFLLPYHLVLLLFSRRISERINIQQEKTGACLDRLARATYLKESKVPELHEELSRLEELTKLVRENPFFADLSKRSDELLAFHPLSQHKHRLREIFLKEELARKKDFFDTVEKNPLTVQQREAISSEDDHTLVLAAAGTGKTSVLAGKVIDLILNRRVNPAEILCLAYNKKAAEELTERVQARLRTLGAPESAYLSFKAHTFHGIGKRILEQVHGRRSVCELRTNPVKFRDFVRETVCSKVRSSRQYFELVSELFSIREEITDEEEYRNRRVHKLLSLSRDIVKSKQELLIANWLFRMGVPFEYERRYPENYDIAPFSSYRPDFYLPSIDAYLEHFGIDRLGRTAPNINAETYNRDIATKREIHARNRTTLLETFSYDDMEGKLIERLKGLLDAKNVSYAKRPEEQIYDRVSQAIDESRLSSTLVRILELCLADGISPPEARNIFMKNDVLFGEQYACLLADLHADYLALKERNNEIDFDDMILGARDEIEKGAFSPPWNYVLVDEFQDISRPRFELIKTIRQIREGSILYCVGDDWQSIYGFGGSRVEYISNFEHFVGPHTERKIENTFRYNSSIARVAGDFVMKNPAQKTKHIESFHTVDSSTVYLTHFASDRRGFESLARIVGHLKSREPEASVGFLYRTHRYGEIFKEALQAALECGERDLQDMKLEFHSMHSSKGLEFDHVFVTSLWEGAGGIPDRSATSRMIACLNPHFENFDAAEERRLFYVALTRGRKGAYLLADASHPSSFVVEILRTEGYDVQLMSDSFADDLTTRFPRCSKCNELLVVKVGPFGHFSSCRNYKTCASSQTLS